MHIFRAYGVPLLATLPVPIALGLLAAFLIPLVSGEGLRLLLFLLTCVSSVVIAAFVLHHMPDYTLEQPTDENASDDSKGKPE